MPDWIDGMLEGHESPGHRLVYRGFIICYIIFSAFSALCNFCLIGKEFLFAETLVTSVVVIALVPFSLMMVALYRKDSMAPKFKMINAGLMFIVLVLGASLCMAFHRGLTEVNASPPAPVQPTPIPFTFAPPAPHTPTPNATSNMTFAKDVGPRVRRSKKTVILD